MGNSSLHAARLNVNDEFYTQLETVEEEVKHYVNHFRDKVVYLNCDDARWSNFYTYFHNNFKELKLKALISSHYVEQDRNLFNLDETFDRPLATYYDGFSIEGWWMKGDGCFRSQESIELLLESDIVVTNPPFSLFRDFISLMNKKSKSFLVIGSSNAIITGIVSELFYNSKITPGYNNGPMTFIKAYDNVLSYNTYSLKDIGAPESLGNVTWWTNLIVSKYNKPLELNVKYEEENYSKFSNSNFINVDRVADIPLDYYGVMGVPISIIFSMNYEQFEYLGISRNVKVDGKIYNMSNRKVDGENKYARAFIRRRDIYG